MVQLKSIWQKHQCDRCGFTYKKKNLKRQRGLLVCCDCYDGYISAPVYPKWGSERPNGTTVTAVTEPVVFSITTAGITALGQSFDYDNDGVHYHHTMYVQGSGGAITLSSIVAATAQGVVLTLRGDSDTNTITINESSNIQLIEDNPITLKEGDTLSLVFQSSLSFGTMWGDSNWGEDNWGVGTGLGGWQETSRNIGGI